MITDDSQAEKSAQLLSQANLHRLRREWDEAVTSAMQVLYTDPDNYRAHALLGDIYADQNRPDEAIRWYCMTLDIHPDSSSTREKLNRIVTTRRQEFVESLDPTRPLVNRDGKAFAKSPIGMLSWQMSSPERKRRLISAFVVALIVLTVIAVPLVAGHNQLGQKNVVFMPGSSPTSPTLFLVPAPQTDASQTSAANSQASAAAAQVSVPSQTASTAANPGVSHDDIASPANHDASEVSLISSLATDSALTSSGTHVVDAEIDPLTNTLSVTYSCDPSAGELTPERIMRSGLGVAKEAFFQGGASNVQTCVVRCLTPPADQSANAASMASGETSASSSSPTLAFVATLARTSLASISQPDKLTDDQVSQSFSSVWWSQASSSSTPPTGQSTPTS